MFNVEEMLNLIQRMGGSMCRVAQKMLVIFIFILIFIFSYFYVNNLITVSYYDRYPYSVLFYFLIGVFILYNLVFNYIMCNRTGPGHPQDIKNEFANFNEIITKKCKKCGGAKPIRTHHCSICQQCILQMDHHCPWIGVCIGHNNRQYFLNFLMNVIVVSLVYVAMMRKFRMFKGEVYFFMYTIFIVIGAFGLFHWFLALRGRTTLEVCEIYDGYKPSNSISLNFKIIYGTTNIVKAFLPIPRQLTYVGCQWNQNLNEPGKINYEDELQEQLTED